MICRKSKKCKVTVLTGLPCGCIIKPRKVGEINEGKAQSSICGQPRKDYPAAKPCGVEKPIHTAKALSENEDLDGTDRFMEKHAIREEDEITMCDIFTQYEQKGREEGIELGCLKTVQSIMKKLNLTVEEALEAADIPKSEWSKYESRLDIQN